jgi:Ni,Fe-hydrogenase III large subunit/Ni,Fe-hydrogenase III component G
MLIPVTDLGLVRLGTELPLWHARVSAYNWTAAALAVAEKKGRLLSLWATDASGQDSGMVVSAVYVVKEGLVWLSLPINANNSLYPGLSGIFPIASRMQRAAADLAGVIAEGSQDTRQWLNHGAWPTDYFPLRQKLSGQEVFPDQQLKNYPFVRVEGDGVHEIPVGPVHAGIIEPGHFRFSIVGEKVLRLEERLGYTHKGIEKRFTQLPPLEAYQLAGRISGDSTVAYAWVYCMALESAANCSIPMRASWLRALMLERERIANHLGDLGALGNDAALAFGLAQFSRLREDWLRLSQEVFGHRLMMDCIIPGGVVSDVDRITIERLCSQCDIIEREVQILRRVYDEHAGLQDRFITTGRVQPELATQLGLIGLAGRASGQAIDLRCNHPWPPYDTLDVKMATHRNGDVAARVTVRFEEVFESLRLIRAICAGLPDGEIHTKVNLPENTTVGAGWIEGWRGEIFVALELDGMAKENRILNCHCHDPSWQNWPVLEHAVIGNIVPDFPLINKSFNLSYSGHDL